MPEMPIQSPLHSIHTQHEAFFLPYGSAETVSQVVECFGDLDMEYASIRKGCVIFDASHMGTMIVTGSERGDFLNNMLTNKVDDLATGSGIRTFWLNKKGRIEADIRIAQREDKMFFMLDRHLCAQTAKTLNDFIFAEDAEVLDASEQYHRLHIHGPTSCKLVALASESDVSALDSLDELCNIEIAIAGIKVLIQRDDLTGEVGLDLCIPTDGVAAVYDRLLAVADEHESLKARAGGWLAINAARIEAGRPLYHIDFTDDHLPIESGVFDSRVSLTKGCYLGQEVVARMHARKACAKHIVAIKLNDERITAENQEIHQPTGGSQIFEPGKEGETPIGNVTSSTISPMLGAIPVCFAMVKEKFTAKDTVLSVSAEGILAPCTVQESLVLWSKA